MKNRVLYNRIKPKVHHVRVLVTDLHIHHLQKTFYSAEMDTNLQLVEYKSNPHGRKNICNLLYHAIDAHFYSPPGSDHHQMRLMKELREYLLRRLISPISPPITLLTDSDQGFQSGWSYSRGMKIHIQNENYLTPSSFPVIKLPLLDTDRVIENVKPNAPNNNILLNSQSHPLQQDHFIF